MKLILVCSEEWRRLAKLKEWLTFVKGICKTWKQCKNYPTGCKQCLDNAEVTKLREVKANLKIES